MQSIINSLMDDILFTTTTTSPEPTVPPPPPTTTTPQKTTPTNSKTNTTDSSGCSNFNRLAFYRVITRLLEITHEEPQLADFYLSQLLQIHLQFAFTRSAASCIKLNMLQQALLAIALTYPSLGLRIAWGLLASLSDYVDQQAIAQTQYAACLSLLLQLELVTHGTVSSFMEVPACHVLASIFVGAVHQQQEMLSELHVSCRKHSKKRRSCAN
jgi:hypothetical protein